MRNIGDVFMFIINYRITEDIKYLKSLELEIFDNNSDLEGFFSMTFNNKSYGYYHDNPLREEENGWDLITNWFSLLLNAYLELIVTKYVAISDIESYNSWIELKMEDDKVVVNIIETEKEDGMEEITTKPFNEFKYGDWNNVLIELKDFKEELILKTKKYLNEIAAINPKLLESRRMKNIKELLLKVENS
jgi:hypothetical protein